MVNLNTVYSGKCILIASDIIFILVMLLLYIFFTVNYLFSTIEWLFFKQPLV